MSAPGNPLFDWSGDPALGQRPVPPPPPSLAQRPRERRSPVTIVLGALGALVVVGLVTAYLMSQHTAATQTLTVINHSTDQARATQQKAALTDAATAEESWAVDHDGAYTANVADLGLATTANVTVTVVSASATAYCLEATVTTPPGVTPPPPWFYAGQGGGLTSTPCH